MERNDGQINEDQQAVTWEEFYKIILDFIDFEKESETVKNLKEWRVR